MTPARFLLWCAVPLLSLAFVANSPAQSTNSPTRHHSSTSTHRKSPPSAASQKSDADSDSSDKPHASPTPSKPSTAPASDTSDDAPAKTTPQNEGLLGPVVATISPSELASFGDNPPAVQKLLQAALDLTTKNLGYLYGSADPSQPGMDCSGTVYYLLQQQGMKDVPRSSDEQYAWVRKSGNFRAVESTKADSFEFNELKPGDLLFWEGTYNIQRDIPITHSMIYLGKAKSDGLALMVGASDGRSYRGKKCYGVSVFEFKMPPAGSKSRFVGYAHLPGLGALTKQP